MMKKIITLLMVCTITSNFATNFHRMIDKERINELPQCSKSQNVLRMNFKMK